MKEVSSPAVSMDPALSRSLLFFLKRSLVGLVLMVAEQVVEQILSEPFGMIGRRGRPVSLCTDVDGKSERDSVGKV